MTQEASIAPADGHGAQTPSPTARHWLEEAIPDTETWDLDGRTVPLSAHPALRKYAGVRDMARALASAQALIGRKTVGLAPLPGDASDDDRARFDAELRRLTGVPAGPEGYDIALPEGQRADARLMGWFRTAAHELGLSPGQAQGLSDRYNELAARTAREFEAQRGQRRAETLGVLEQLWGEDARGNTEIARRGFEAVAGRAGLDPAETRRILDAHGDDPVLVRLFHEIGKANQEDGFVGGIGGPAPRGQAMTPERFFAEVVFGGKGE